MNRDELKKAISDTLNLIVEVKVQIDHETDPVKIAELMFKKKDLQYLQLWQIEQWGMLGE